MPARTYCFPVEPRVLLLLRLLRLLSFPKDRSAKRGCSWARPAVPKSQRAFEVVPIHTATDTCITPWVWLAVTKPHSPIASKPEASTMAVAAVVCAAAFGATPRSDKAAAMTRPPSRGYAGNSRLKQNKDTLSHKAL